MNKDLKIERKKGRVLGDGSTPVFSIDKGHCRTAVMPVDDGFVFVFCVAEKYHTPGEAVEEEEDLLPVFGIKLWGIEQFSIIAECLMAAAKQCAERAAHDE